MTQPYSPYDIAVQSDGSEASYLSMARDRLAYKRSVQSITKLTNGFLASDAPVPATGHDQLAANRVANSLGLGKGGKKRQSN